MTRIGRAGLILGMCLWGCDDYLADGPSELSITPTSGVVGEPLVVVVEGIFVDRTYEVDHQSGKARALDSTFTIRVGGAPLDGVQVLNAEDARCDLAVEPEWVCATGTVSASLPAGWQTLEVEDARGLVGGKPDAVFLASLEPEISRPLEVSVIEPERSQRFVGEVTTSPPPMPPFTPSNGLPTDGFFAGRQTIDTSTAGDLWLSTEDGSIRREDDSVVRAPGEGFDPISGIGFQHVTQSSPGQDIGVFTASSVFVGPDTVLRGVGPAALAIVSGSDIVVEGVIDVSGGAEACFNGMPRIRCAGPGGARGDGTCQPCCNRCVMNGACGACPINCVCVRCQPSSQFGNGGRGSAGSGQCYPEAGGGGGGHASAGGTGGNVGGFDDPDAVFLPGGAPGGVYGQETLIPLTGGGGGGGGGDEDQLGTRGGRGGGGGGGLQLVARDTIVVQPSSPTDPDSDCGIDAGGSGGEGGESSAGGGGGGAGGGILLEAPEVILEPACVLAANGGGGGGSDAGEDGEDGHLTADRALGGSTADVCRSGPGAVGAVDLGDVVNAISCPFNCTPVETCNEAGGGGGGVGVIRINGDTLDVQGVTSPPHSTGPLAPF